MTGWTLDHVQLAIPPGGEAVARTFWCDLLDLTELPKPASLRGRGGLWLDTGGPALHLGVEDPFAPARKAHPCFAVPDLPALAARLAGAGRPVRPDHSLDRPRLFTEDPFGNRLEFTAG